MGQRVSHYAAFLSFGVVIHLLFNITAAFMRGQQPDIMFPLINAVLLFGFTAVCILLLPAATPKWGRAVAAGLIAAVLSAIQVNVQFSMKHQPLPAAVVALFCSVFATTSVVSYLLAEVAMFQWAKRQKSQAH